MNKSSRMSHVDQQGRTFLAFTIVIIYFITVIVVVLAVVRFDAPLFTGADDPFPTHLMLIIWFLYYVAPIFLAVVFGIFFRPFWRNFRNIYFAILAVQVLYSFTLSMVRWDYLVKFKQENRWHKRERIKIVNLSSLSFDRNEDGIIDEIRIKPDFDFSKVRPGRYLIDASLVPSGSLSPVVMQGGGEFVIQKRGNQNTFVKEFIMQPDDPNPGDITQSHEEKFQIKFLFFRMVIIDDKAKKIMKYSRWAPFLRKTQWQGTDPEIYDDMRLLDSVTPPDIYQLLVPAQK